jgi:hypothetical protein
MIEFLVNSYGEVAIFINPQKYKPVSCSINGKNLTIQFENKIVNSYNAPKTFLKPLKRKRYMLVVECNVLGTLRETEINLM